jgi:hypothetical protein
MKFRAWLFLASICICCCGEILAAQEAGVALPGRLFYTPQQRAMLGNARTHNITQSQQSDATGHAPADSAPLSFDGVITRSDGRATHWVDGRSYAGAPSAGIRGLKPGQIRANSKVYEPYQLLRPAAAPQAPIAEADKPPDPQGDSDLLRTKVRERSYARAQESVDAP